jgi:hypothetical protein
MVKPKHRSLPAGKLIKLMKTFTMLGIVRAETPPGLDASVAIARETLRFEASKAAWLKTKNPDFERR